MKTRNKGIKLRYFLFENNLIRVFKIKKSLDLLKKTLSYCLKKSLQYLKNNYFISFILISSILFALILFVDICNKSNVNDENDTVNTFLTIQVAISTLIITFMSIAMSFFNDSIYGEKIKDIIKLRKGIVFDLQKVVITLLLLSIFETMFVFVQDKICFLYSSLFLLFLSIIIGIIISIQDLPICLKNDKRIIRLLKKAREHIVIDKKIKHLKSTDIYNNMMINFVVDKGIDKAYELLKINENDKVMIDYLFTLIINKLSFYKTFDNDKNKLEFDSFANAIMDNVNLLFNSEKGDFLKQFEIKNISVYFAKMLFFIHGNINLLDETTKNKYDEIFRILFLFLMIQNENNANQSIIFAIYQNLLYMTLCKCDLWVAEMIKKSLSQFSETFVEYKYTNILFSEISFVLFNQKMYDNLIPNDKKDKIDSFITDVINGTSWLSMFKRHLQRYSLNYIDLQENIVPGLLDYSIENHPKMCVITDSSLAEWWIKCLFYSSNLYRYNFSFLENITNKETLVECIKILFSYREDEQKYNEYFKSFEDFFNLKNKYIKIVNNKNGELISKLQYFYEKEEKNKIQSDANKNDVASTLNQLSLFLKDEIKRYFEKLSNKDDGIDLSRKNEIGFYIRCEMFELDESKALYLNVIKNFIDDQIRKNYNREQFTYLSFDNSLKTEDMKKFLEINPTFATNKIMNFLNFTKQIDPEIKKRCIELDKNIKIKDCSSILPLYCYGNEKSVKINYEITTFKIDSLSDDELLSALDEYKDGKGTYFYRGIQYSYLELFDILKNTLFTIRLFYKIVINYDKENIYEFNIDL
ncbi:MAG: hypothetical protein MR270_05315 [Erysipelotrichaceae bacterium]|nr:hypothetical protein [Erysipelotrichaceae bacterium]